MQENRISSYKIGVRRKDGFPQKTRRQAGGKGCSSGKPGSTKAELHGAADSDPPSNNDRSSDSRQLVLVLPSSPVPASLRPQNPKTL